MNVCKFLENVENGENVEDVEKACKCWKSIEFVEIKCVNVENQVSYPRCYIHL